MNTPYGKDLLEEYVKVTRAKGGNLLLNLGPKPNGELPEEQEENLREIAAWNFINHEALEKVRPWILFNEENIWFTWKPKERTLYAFLTKIPVWERGARKEFLIKSVQATENTKVSVLGQSGEVILPDDSAILKAGFQYRQYAGFVEELYSDEWHETETIEVSESGIFFIKPEIKKEGKEYQVRAFVDIQNLRVYGDILRVNF